MMDLHWTVFCLCLRRCVSRALHNNQHSSESHDMRYHHTRCFKRPISTHAVLQNEPGQGIAMYTRFQMHRSATFK
ncbi:uncharacterized protein PHALS_14504 [Plasmopara halstedii]|uniref:RxLR-like protein n=1 Tax=Plasmopara halstedii TaxID=4781 RepID=A0A0P1A506_PLAHL|nr:uncharacterized protein PHALS_14504 [Plasmopara halstedii]CEG35578.1 hypothetical protein PHALS_14504 [Plasmopara halstedii]|eukprot:XP_024571947.1 hypothetical protein PHALS_14504 [Plasmopara halstedii]